MIRVKRNGGLLHKVHARNVWLLLFAQWWAEKHPPRRRCS